VAGAVIKADNGTWVMNGPLRLQPQHSHTSMTL